MNSDWKVGSNGEIYDGEWQLLRDTPEQGVRKWIMAVDEDNFIVKTEFYAAEAFMEENARLRAENEGKRWGDGQVVARIPNHIKFGELLEPTRQQDEKWMKRWLNDPDNSAWRIFPGKV